MKRTVFSSDMLPPALDEDARFKRWFELCRASFPSPFDLSRAEDRQFGVRWDFLQIDGGFLTKYRGSLARAARDRRQVVGDSQSDFALSINTGAAPWRLSQRGRELVARPGDGVFYKIHGDPHEFRFRPDGSWISFSLPENELLARIPNAQDLVLEPINPANPALRHLQRYAGILFDQDDIQDDPALSAFVNTTLFDLVALALGARRDEADLAGMRGLRAARLAEVLARIKEGFSEPDFSTQALAMKMGLSAKYVQKLLYETGTSFTERVLELRLQKARGQLADRRNDCLRVSDIALACGFNEVSYFNRCFRRRFGETPTQWRGGHGRHG